AVGIAQRSGRVRFRYRPAQQRPGRQHGAPRGSPHRIRELRICDRREMAGDVEGRGARGFARADHSATGEYRATVVAAGDRDNGAGARDQADRGRRQQRVGNRARDQRVCTTTQWRPAGAAGKSRPRERRCDRRVGRAASAAGDVHASHRDVRRRPDVLRYRYRRPLPPRRLLCRSHPQGGESGRSAGAGADQVRTCGEPQDCQGARPHCAAHAARHRRRGDRVRRREFITVLGGAAAWPLAARAQQPSTQVARIGVLNTGLDDAVSGGLGYRAFVAELQKLGFTEGRNLVIDYGRTDQGADKAFADAATMGRSNVAVIVASGFELPLQAAVAASPSVPIVILANNYDPIARGYVTSLARPGGRITGLFNRQPELAQKRVELLTEAFPTRTRLAVLWDASSSEAFAAAE